MAEIAFHQFGDAFRDRLNSLGYSLRRAEEVWPEADRAMLSRAIAGTIDDTFVVCVPGSTNAVTLAWEKLLAPELQHLAWEITR